jgi:hypothetical protein
MGTIMNRSRWTFTDSLVLLALWAACWRLRSRCPHVAAATTSPLLTTSPTGAAETATPAVSPVVTPVREQSTTPEAAGNHTFCR